MNVKLRVILSLEGILVLCLAFSMAMASGSNPPNPLETETPVPPEPVIEQGPAAVEGQDKREVYSPLPELEFPNTNLPGEAIRPVEQTDQPHLFGQEPISADDLQPEAVSAGTIEAVVVRSWGACSSSSLVWDSLNTTWSSYGTTPIHITYNNPALCSGTITYDALVASGADVLIFSASALVGPSFSPQEIAAIQKYTNEGHHLIGTFLMLQYGSVDNRLLAPLFGIQASLTYINLSPIIPTYSFLEPANPLFKKLVVPYLNSVFTSSQVPASGTWSAAALNGARIAGITPDLKAAILSYHAPNYHATYIANMPEFFGGTEDKQLIYNAITYDVIEAVVIRSWDSCSSNSLIWDDLNVHWSDYGPVPIHIRYAQPGLCSGTITYAALAASGADVIILSDPAGAYLQYSPEEISAIQQYAQEGHNLIGTYLLLQYVGIDNRGLAPLFGLKGGVSYNFTAVTPTYNLLETGNPLYKHLSAPYTSDGRNLSQVPASGTWTAAALNGARIVGINADQKAAILAYDAPNYRAIYITNMPEYSGGTDDKRFLYNAIRYAIDVVVARSWDACTSNSMIWDSLNATSVSYGSYPVHIIYDYHGLCDAFIDITKLEASKADVVILSDPAGAGKLYTPTEISAIQTYANEGHQLIGTFAMLQFGGTDNRGLAPLFGLQGGITYNTATVIPTYNYLEAANPLFQKLGATYESDGIASSQVPVSGTWPGAALNGARIAGITPDQKAVILSYHAPNYHATYITSMPEYNGGITDKQLFYNAITYDVIDAVVVRSSNPCSSASLIWDSLNASWPSYGTVPIHIRYAQPGLCDGTFDTITYEDLVASKADVVILSNPAGTNQQYSAGEISALQMYAQDGHHLIGTYLLLQSGSYDNRGLAPIFGLLDGLTYNSIAIVPEYSFLEANNPLFRKLSAPYLSDGYEASQVPASLTWDANALNGARIVGIKEDLMAAILVYPSARYHAIYITSMPEFGGGVPDKQFFYNAILYRYWGFLPIILK